jgi:glycosyltransferase involved in cell wall biosynthesis
MITTFFGPHSFGGDAAYVDRLSRALLRRGHEVDVIYNADAFDAIRGSQPDRPYDAPPGLRVHALRTPLGKFGLLWTHQTSGLGPLRKPLEEIVSGTRFDVIHFHNISLMGGMEVLEAGNGALRLMTAHEHWLCCPLSLMWKRDRQVCDRPECVSCTIAAGRPPQLWRYSGLRDRMLQKLDFLLTPSLHSRALHQDRGVARRIEHLPIFIPDEMIGTEPPLPELSTRPYFVAAGRLIQEKGFSDAIAQMRNFPDADLVIAGAGPFGEKLRDEASGLTNVRFTGLLSQADLAGLFRGARALLVPSRFPETFGYVVLEAFAVGVPAIVSDRGALPELIADSGAGLVARNATEMCCAMRRYLENPEFARSHGRRGRDACAGRWSESSHLARYLKYAGAH